MPDMIEVGSFIGLAAMTKSEILIKIQLTMSSDHSLSVQKAWHYCREEGGTIYISLP